MSHIIVTDFFGLFIAIVGLVLFIWLFSLLLNKLADSKQEITQQEEVK